jgi:amino acid transporter
MNEGGQSKPPGIWRLTALAIGSMVGAGVFALLGEAAIVAGPAVWISFLVAGFIALLTGHTFVRLAVRFPSRGGVVEYLVQSYGTGVFSGSCSLLFYISQLIGMAMISLAFGKFAARLLTIESNSLFWERVLACALILVLSGFYLFGSAIVSKTQRLIVVLNLSVLSAFSLGLAANGTGGRLAVETYPEPTLVLGSISLTFMAFTGFAVITNAADRVRNPAQELPRAMYLAIGLVMALYVALALVSAVEATSLESEGAALLVTAARAHFGVTGFYLLLLTAIAGTISCLNGGLFGAINITFALAEKGQLPPRLKQEVKATTRGLTFTAAVAVLLVCLFDLSSVASLGSAPALIY